MRKTRNITCSGVRMELNGKARVWTAKRNTSVSAMGSEYILDYLPAVVQALHELRKKYPEFETRGRTPE